MFYMNLRLSCDSGKLKTLMLGLRIIMNNFMFQNAFDTKFYRNICFMNGNWPYDHEASFEEAKKFLPDTDSSSANFFPLSLYFKFCIKAYIIYTTLIPPKESLSNITGRDFFVL